MVKARLGVLRRVREMLENLQCLQSSHPSLKGLRKKGSGTNGSMIKASKSFVCRGGTDQPFGTDRTIVDIDGGKVHLQIDGGNVEQVSQFKYLESWITDDRY